MPNMNPIKKSSTLKEIGQDGDDLLISFISGKTWRYIGAAHEYEPMMGAESAGKYFYANIKKNYKAEPVGK